MASGNNNTPFFGCKISLISKSEIRYEGLLYTIDPKESTIALAKVRSFGSEDRVVERPVPPRDDIFEFIIFRASDIKDLIVDDPPPTPSAPAALADPAIVQAHATSTSFPSSFPQPSITSAQPAALQQLQRAAAPAASKPATSSEPTTSVSQSAASQDSSKPKATSGASVNANSFQRNNATNNSNANRQPNQRNFNNRQQQQQHQQPQQQQQPQSNNRTNDGHPNSNQSQQQNNFGNANNNNYGNRPNTNFVRRNNPMNNGQNHNMNNNNMNNRGGRLEENNYQRNGQQNFRSNNFNNSNRYPPRQPVNGPFNRRPNNRNIGLRPGHKPFGTAIPDSEFDFEKAQNDFKILEEKLANLKVNGSSAAAEEGSEVSGAGEEAAAPIETVNTVSGDDPLKEKCYNKTKSFFDNISCEALEREKGVVQRVDWKTERKMNRETFGIVPPRRTPMYRGNRGGYNNHSGGGYRGYRQNTGNYHHPNNRNRTSSQRSSNPPNQNSNNNNANTSSAVGGASTNKPNLNNSSNTPNHSKSAHNGVSSATAAVASTTTPTIASIVAASAAQIISPAKN